MKGYNFYLLFFFLTSSALATGLDSSYRATNIANINSNPEKYIIPNSNANKNIRSKKKNTSTRNSNEIENSRETPISNGEVTSSTKDDVKTKSLKTSSNNKSCKTYEGKIYGQGEAGYNECILKVKNDQQVIKNVP